MSWVHKSDGTGASGISTSAISVPYPAGVSAHDTIFLVCDCGLAGVTFTISDGGFTAGVSRSVNGSIFVLLKDATGSESGTFTITSTNVYRCFYQTTLFSGGPLAANFSASIIAAVGRGSSGTNGILYPSTGTALAGHDNLLIIAAGGKLNNGTSISNPAPFPNQIGTQHSTAPDCFIWNYGIQTTGTDIAAGSWSVGSGDSNAANQGVILAIAPTMALPNALLSWPKQTFVTETLIQS